MPEVSLMDELDTMNCWCGRDEDVCEENGGCRWSAAMSAAEGRTGAAELKVTLLHSDLDAALAKLAAIEALCRQPSHAELQTSAMGITGSDLVRAADILAITGTEREVPPSSATRTAAKVTVSLECGHEGWIYDDETACKFAWCDACKQLRIFVPARDTGTGGGTGHA